MTITPIQQEHACLSHNIEYHQNVKIYVKKLPKKISEMIICTNLNICHPVETD